MNAIALRYWIKSKKRKRQKISVKWLYIWTVVLGAASIPWAAWSAYQWRGYKAVGGELLIPAVALMIMVFIQQVIRIKKSAPAATDAETR
jgi:predicted phage tail protein|nr:MAG TPA: hypothetical protein [Caudoviricetes sp.]